MELVNDLFHTPYSYTKDNLLNHQFFYRYCTLKVNCHQLFYHHHIEYQSKNLEVRYSGYRVATYISTALISCSPYNLRYYIPHKQVAK